MFASPELPKSTKVGKETMRWIDELLREIEFDGLRELDKLGRERRERKSASRSRLMMGLFSCIALIVPMLIMALHPKRDVALITTSVVTIIFAVIAAFGARESSGKDVLLVTAAYAAVFVVFVGSSLSAPQT
jgi:VIT1/CCC1 family predicted Fe2+/Mn2+ transporter